MIGAGASCTKKNSNGMGVMHKAAENDQLWPVVYFHRKHKMSVDLIDIYGNTPLHSACDSGAISVVDYLLKWTTCINLPNKDGKTPLHLATKIAISTGSRRLVKLLCFYGAERKIADINGKRPIDYVTDEIQTNISNKPLLTDLLSILKEQTDCTCFMIRVPAKKVNRSIKLPLLFCLFQFLHELAIGLLVFPRISSIIEGYNWQEAFIITNVLLHLISIIFYGACSLIDPGVHKPGYIDLLTLIEKSDVDDFCSYCEVVRSPSTRHCVICKRCVERYDHHCPWINNCVGIRNHNFFLLFLIATFLHFLLDLVAGGRIAWMYLDSDFECEGKRRFDLWCEFHNQSIIFAIILGVISVILLVFILFMGILLGVQLINYCKGMTTNERFGANTQENKEPKRKWCVSFCLNYSMPSQEKLYHKPYADRHSINHDMKEELLSDNKSSLNIN